MVFCSKSLTAAIFAITLMLSLAVNTAEARVHPSSTTSSSSQELGHSHADSKQPSTTRLVAASLRTIPPSIPNPTQNK
ncbi:hypothetical protein FH972_010432 [Carpinus fangiana]|uniref:Uncharacterized protein n=1 Tax=Carpinus fangiana TaxID=176857 RepID=A0A660KUC7_9ROSI|nr:hypothetical protein FH972_010432 [Carpinus fangiana]